MPFPSFDALKRLFDTKSYSLSDPALPLEWFGAVPTTSGVIVSPQTAMRVPAVAAAVELIAQAVGTLPVKIYERQTGGGKVALGDHSAFGLLHDIANPWTSASELRSAVTMDALLHDRGGFAQAVRVDGQVRELHRLDPNNVSIEYDRLTGEPSYLVSSDAGQARFHFTDIVHLAPFGGIAPITRAREAIALAITLEGHAARLFSKGVKPSGHLEFPESVSPEQMAKVRDHFIAQGQSGFGVLDRGGTLKMHILSSVDSQFAEMRHFQIEEISRAFRVSPVFLSELGRATWSNSEEMGRQFLTYTLRPWLRAWEDAYRRVLLSDDERESTIIEFVTDDLLTVDFATRATAYAQYRAMGAMTANEVRAGLNLPAHANGNALDNPNITTSSQAA